jgi:hypothetical protein
VQLTIEEAIMEEEQSTRPGVVQALRAVLQEDFDEDREFARVELRIRQTGEVAYRLFPADGSDYVGGICVVAL